MNSRFGKPVMPCWQVILPGQWRILAHRPTSFVPSGQSLSASPVQLKPCESVFCVTARYPLDPVDDLYNAVSMRYAVPVDRKNSSVYAGMPRPVVTDGLEKNNVRCALSDHPHLYRIVGRVITFALPACVATVAFSCNIGGINYPAFFAPIICIHPPTYCYTALHC